MFRLARAPDPWAWPGWSKANQGTFGNRWDDPAGVYRVLYASSTRFGALIETLARFRADLAVLAGIREIEGEDDPTPAGTVPREWFERRLIGSAKLDGIYAEIGVFEPAPGSPSPLRLIGHEPIRPEDPDVAAALIALDLRVE